MTVKVTAPGLKSMKSKGEKIVCVTAYDYPAGLFAELAGIDVVLVGDSVGNAVLGYETTVPVTQEEILHHLRAVKRAVKTPLLVADMPFGTYNVSPGQAVASAVELMKNGAEAVKLEGDYPDAVAAIHHAGIPVMGHVGFTPQSVHRFGGFKVQGKGEDADKIQEVALALQQAGAFSIVLELMPAQAARQITESLEIPTIGIGGGPECDGEIQVFHDIMGLSEKPYKHTKFYVEGRKLLIEALQLYAQEVRNRQFPAEENSF